MERTRKRERKREREREREQMVEQVLRLSSIVVVLEREKNGSAVNQERYFLSRLISCESFDEFASIRLICGEPRSLRPYNFRSRSFIAINFHIISKIR